MSVVRPAERRRVLEEAYSPWVSRTLAQHLDHVTERHGDKVFVLTDDRSYTYSEMQAWSMRIAGGLIELGIKPGEHVAVVMANYPAFIAIKFAIARVGAVCVPVNFLLRERELSYVLQQSDAVCLITMERFRQSEYVDMYDAIMVGWEQNGGGDAFPQLRHVVVFPDPADGSPRTRPAFLTLADLEARTTTTAQQRLHVLATLADPSQPSDILYTSGTTGNPKGVLLTHDMVVRTGYASAFSRGLTSDYRSVYSLPMYHVFGYIECLLAASFSGGSVVPRLAFDPADILSSVARFAVNEIACVPTMTLALLSEATATQYDLSSIAVIYSSGGPAAVSIWDDIRAVFRPHELVHGYGQTETTAAMTFGWSEESELTDEIDQCLRYANGQFRPAGIAGDASLGGVLAVYEAVDVQTGAILPRGERGELVVRGPAVTSGYYNKPEETAATIDANGWLHTGDLGIVDADNFVSLVGRLKETYRCGGEMVMPKEVENLLVEFPGVEQAQVVGIPHLRMGEVGCAVIVASAEQPPPVEGELIAWCAKHLARFKVPAHVVFMEATELPLTVTGRVQKFRLVELAVARIQAGENARPASG